MITTCSHVMSLPGEHRMLGISVKYQRFPRKPAVMMSPGTSREPVPTSVVWTRGVQSSLRVQGSQWGRATVGEDGAFGSMCGTQPDGEGPAGQLGSHQVAGGGGVPSSSGPQGEGQAMRLRGIRSGVQGKGHRRERM